MSRRCRFPQSRINVFCFNINRSFRLLYFPHIVKGKKHCPETYFSPERNLASRMLLAPYWSVLTISETKAWHSIVGLLRSNLLLFSA